jgi:hypothetical protein
MRGNILLASKGSQLSVDEFFHLRQLHSPTVKKGESPMATATVKDNHLNFNGINYFRGNAEEVQLGSYGEKRTPLTKMNYLEVKGRIPSANMAKATSTVVEIDATKMSKTDFKADIKAIIKGVPVNLKGDAAFKKLVNNELKLVKFSVLNNAMKVAVNKSPGALKNLEHYGKDARIAHQIFVVMEAKLATKYDNDVSVNLSAGAGPMKVSLGGGHSSIGETTVQISAGTTFAYLLVSIDWNDKKTKVADLDDDQWSLS